MRTLFFGACIAALASSAAVAQQHFTFTDQMNDYNSSGAGVITGSFDGTLNGNLITDLSNISVFIDGVAFNGNGALYAFHGNSDLSAWISGDAVASLDGTQNNFLFLDGADPNGTDYSNYYFSSSSQTYAVAYNMLTGQDSEEGHHINFHAQLVDDVTTSVPEPASWALIVGGFGLVGGAMRSRRKVAVRFG